MSDPCEITSAPDEEQRARAAAWLDSIVEAFDGCESFLIQAHNNPDPDSIACAFALRYLVKRYTGHNTVIAFGGIVGRS